MNRDIINQIFTTFAKNNPEPTTELVYTDNFTLLVAVILSAQATDVSVNKSTKELFKQYSSPESIVTLGEAGLKSYIKTIGLYNSKAKNIIAMCKILIDRHESKVPSTLQELENLPGVGRKTANVILNTAFNMPVIAVDTHVMRVSKRLGLTRSNNPLKIEEDLYRQIPEGFLYKSHHWLVLHGRYVCKARAPLCRDCIVRDFCEYYKTTTKTS